MQKQAITTSSYTEPCLLKPMKHTKLAYSSLLHTILDMHVVFVTLDMTGREKIIYTL